MLEAPHQESNKDVAMLRSGFKLSNGCNLPRTQESDANACSGTVNVAISAASVRVSFCIPEVVLHVTSQPKQNFQRLRASIP